MKFFYIILNIFLVLFINRFHQKDFNIVVENFREAHIVFMLQRGPGLIDKYTVSNYAFLKVGSTMQYYEMTYHDQMFRVDIILDHDYGGQAIYDQNYQFEMKAFQILSNGEWLVVSPTIIPPMDFEPNSITKFEETKGDYTLTVYVIYRCVGYKGKLCKILIPNNELQNERPTSSICDGTIYCNDIKCPNNYCNDKGQCYWNIMKPLTKYCVCFDKNIGNYCEKTLPDIIISEEMILFRPLEDYYSIKTTPNDCQECPDLKCSAYGNFKICEQSSRQLLLCNEDCAELCGVDVCLKTINDESKIYYLKALKSENNDDV